MGRFWGKNKGDPDHEEQTIHDGGACASSCARALTGAVELSAVTTRAVVMPHVKVRQANQMDNYSRWKTSESLADNGLQSG